MSSQLREVNTVHTVNAAVSYGMEYEYGMSSDHKVNTVNAAVVVRIIMVCRRRSTTTSSQRQYERYADG